MTIEEKIATKLLPEFMDNLTWTQVVAAVQFMGATGKANIVSGIQNDQPEDVGTVLHTAVFTYLQSLARADADTMMADDSLSRTELDRLFP